MSRPDIPLLRKAVEWVEEQDKLPIDQRQWYQGDYISRFRHLWAKFLQIRGSAVAEGVNEETFDSMQREPVCGTCYCVAGYIAMQDNPAYTNRDIVDEVHVADYAMRLLGLDRWEAQHLFAGTNSAADVRYHRGDHRW